MTARSRLRGRRWGALGGVTMLALASLGVVARGEGFENSRVELSGGGAWLASVSQGLVTLIDGASEQVVGSVRAPGARPGDGLSVVQSGSSAYVVNGNQGTVARVDGSTYAASDPVRFGDGGGGTLGVFAGGPALYVVDGRRRTASVTDPVSLRVRDKLSLAAQPGPEQAVVDADGRLWVIDRGQGGLTWFDGGKRVRPDVADAGTRLTLVQGRPVLVDVARSRIGTLSGAGAVDAWSCLEVRAGDEAQVLGSQSSARVFAAVSASGTLVVSTVGRDDCRASVEVGRAGDRFGPLVEVGGFVFVPNRTSGRTIIVDVAAGRVAADIPVVKPGARLELLAKDGFVFYNDLDGDQAGVIRFDGGVWRKGRSLSKYDRSNTGKGILTPVGDKPPKEPPTEDPGGDGGRDPRPPVEPEPNPPGAPPPPPAPPPPGAPPVPGGPVTLTVEVAGAGSVFAESPAPIGLPAGTECPGNSTCVWRFPKDTPVVLRVPERVGDAVLADVVGCQSTSSGGGNRRCELTGTDSAFVRAVFQAGEPPPPPTPVRLNVTVNGNGAVRGSGIACPPTCSAPYDEGDTVRLTAQPGGGFSFVSWGGACSGGRSTCTFTIAPGDNVTATFRERPRLTVQAPANGSITANGIDCPGDCSNTYDIGQNVTLTARPDDGFALADWGGACDGRRTTCTVSMDGDRTVSASFRALPRHTLTIDVNAGGRVTGSATCAGGSEGNICTATFLEGEQVRLRAEPAEGNIFITWRGDCAGEGTCRLTMNGDRSVAADFAVVDPVPAGLPTGRQLVNAAKRTGQRMMLPAVGRRVRPRHEPLPTDWT